MPRRHSRAIDKDLESRRRRGPAHIIAASGSPVLVGVDFCDVRASRQNARPQRSGRRGILAEQSCAACADLRLVVRKLVLVRLQRHQARREPHGAQRRNHRDIHDDPHGPTPRFDHPSDTRTAWFHRVKELRLSWSRPMEILAVWPSGNKRGAPPEPKTRPSNHLMAFPEAPPLLT